MGLIIGSWWLFWRPLYSNWSSANGLAWCTTTHRRWRRWTGSVRKRMRSSGQSGRIALCLFFSMSLLWSPCSGDFRDEKASPALRSILFAVPLSAKVSTYANDITVFVSYYLDVTAVKKAVAWYEQIAGAKIKFGASTISLQSTLGR